MVNNMDEWFEEVCWICEKGKLVHNDERTGHDNPGFICKECEDSRIKTEKMLERAMIGDQ